LAPLPHDWLARFGHRIADLLAAREAAGRLPACVLPDLAALCEDAGVPPPPSLEGLRHLLGDDDRIPEASLPDDLAATLRSYQRRGVDWLCALRDAGLGALLADDMGLGKTLQALCAIRGRTLVVAPTSVIHNWEREARRFRPSLRVCVYHGPGRRLDEDADLTLTTYALLRLDADALSAVDWNTLVLDEAQAVKNPDSQVARAAGRLRGGFRVALTGTPVENRLEELWSQLHFTNPGLLGGRRDFDERVARPVAAGDGGVAERLRARIRPFVLRRLKKEVAPELPPRTDIVLEAELGESERSLYGAIRAATREDVVSKLERGGSVLAALEALLRLRQAACHPALVPGQSAEGSAKTALLLEMLEEAVSEGHKALVFSQWTSLLDLVEPHLASAQLGFARLDGSTRDRAGVVERFQGEGGPPVLLVSLTAGGTGLNLTAADCVFILDPWWNPAVEDQAADRAHRIGQDRPVMVYRLVATDTVEERILALQERKRALADAALGTASGAAELTRDDLLALLE
ncbi:MAG: DEAD/DEAH box helicase, partial [Myxococcota bacterium]|nr:DEAD/DEAH box helicase [Myxococcota bacterium]